MLFRCQIQLCGRVLPTVLEGPGFNPQFCKKLKPTKIFIPTTKKKNILLGWAHNLVVHKHM